MSLIANDKEITIWGLGNSKEPLFMEWREIRTVVLQHNNILGSILLYRKVKGQPMEEIRLDLQRFCDLSDFCCHIINGRAIRSNSSIGLGLKLRTRATAST